MECRGLWLWINMKPIGRKNTLSRQLAALCTSGRTLSRSWAKLRVECVGDNGVLRRHIELKQLVNSVNIYDTMRTTHKI